jgi:hypothetical protein
MNARKVGILSATTLVAMLFSGCGMAPTLQEVGLPGSRIDGYDVHAHF